MRQALLTIACLSVLALTQNVLVVSPEPGTASGSTETVASVSAEPAMAAVVQAPPTASTALLLAGLVGLTVAGGRRPEESEIRAVS